MHSAETQPKAKTTDEMVEESFTRFLDSVRQHTAAIAERVALETIEGRAAKLRAVDEDPPGTGADQITKQEAARLLGKCEKTVDSRANAGCFKRYGKKGDPYFSRREVLAHLGATQEPLSRDDSERAKRVRLLIAKAEK